MTSSISDALERLHLVEATARGKETMDDILERTSAARPQQRQGPAELKAHLEKEYLTPSRTFSTEWLNRLQQ
jgi:antiviral helicase SKI2